MAPESVCPAVMNEQCRCHGGWKSFKQSISLPWAASLALMCEIPQNMTNSRVSSPDDIPRGNAMRMKSAIRCTGLVAILVLLCVFSAQAQLSTASLKGTVTDASGAVVPGADVVATQVQTNYTARVVSDDAGLFSLPSLPVGPYKLKVTAKGFAPYEQTGIVLTVSQVANFQVALKVGGEEQKIEVNADVSTVQTSESTIQSIVQCSDIVDTNS